MVYNVQVKGVNSNIEEEILINIKDIELLCFVSHWGTNIKVGNFYKVDIGVTILDDLDMIKQSEKLYKFEQINDSFAYFIYGKFDFDSHTIDAGILIEFDLANLYDYSYLDEKFVRVRVDRISANFI